MHVFEDCWSKPDETILGGFYLKKKKWFLKQIVS